MSKFFLRRNVVLAVISVAGLSVPGGALHAASGERLSIAGLDVTVWRPGATAPAPWPVIIFSHGFHGCATQSRFLMEAFAAAGYLVVAPNHRDAACDGGSARWIDRPEKQFIRPEAWDESSFRDRADDIRRLIAALRREPDWLGRIDWERCGLVGHSLGGYTVLGLAGAWPGWRLGGIKAVLALSPYVQPFLVHRTLAGLAAPVMYQGGTLDFGITPALGKAMGAYELSPAPKYYVEMKWAGHFAWTDLRTIDRAAIIGYSLAFLDRYVRGSAASPLLSGTMSGVAMMRFDAGSRQ